MTVAFWAAALFWKHAGTVTSFVWLQTKAAPELWMVVSSGCGFLGKRIGCWHRLSGAEGSPHRVPVGAPAGGRGEERNLNKTLFWRVSRATLKVDRNKC